MAVYVVTGKLGSGKGIVSLSRIYDYLWRGRMVATNLDLNLRFLVGRNDRKARVIRVPDHPSPQDLENLPNPNQSYDEGKNGLLCLDECATWLNSHDFRDKTRPEFLNWLLHSRKKGWDVILQIQDFESLDAQIRRSLAEHVVFCRRTDRLPIPVLGALLGNVIRLPKFHIGFVRYGEKGTSPLVDTWITRGSRFYYAYDTRQIFNPAYPHGSHSLLPPGYINYGRVNSWSFARIMRLTKILWRKWNRVTIFGFTMVATASFCLWMVPYKDREVDYSSKMWSTFDNLAKINKPEVQKVYVTLSHPSTSQNISQDQVTIYDPEQLPELNTRSFIEYGNKRYQLTGRGIQVTENN